MITQHLKEQPQSDAPEFAARSQHWENTKAGIENLALSAKPTAYVSRAALDRLNNPLVDCVGVGMNKISRTGLVAVYTAPPASSELLATVKQFALGYLQKHRDDPSICMDAIHHKDICNLFSVIEQEEKRGAV